jgi:DNA polymerase-1
VLLPGYQRHADEERARQAAIHKIDCLPWSPTFSAGAIHTIDTADDAEAWAERLHNEPVAMMGIDTEFAFDRPSVILRNGKEVTDVRSVRPLVCTIAAWCASGGNCEAGGHLIRLLVDLRRSDVYPGLRRLFDLHVPWVAHSAKAELHCLWWCGIEPAEHLLMDTYITASCLHLGRFHKRQRVADAEEAIARTRKLEEKSAHITSLVGQCEHYHLRYPFSKELKNDLRKRFSRLSPDDRLDDLLKGYAMADAEFALRLHLAQAADVHRFGLTSHLAVVEWPLVGAIARMERVGMPINHQRMHKYRELCRSIAEHMSGCLREQGIKPGSRDSFLKAMESAGVLCHFVRNGKYSTQKEVLRDCEHKNLHPAIRQFRLYRYFQKLAQDELLAGLLVSPDDRLRCSLDQIRSVSGRISSSRPNLIGLDQRLRPCFAAPAGLVMIELDYSQKEVGVAGAEWHDAGLMDQFNRGDSYAGMAQVFYATDLTESERAMPPEEFKKAKPKLRKKIKTLVLGILYGSGPAGIASSFGCSIEHAEAELTRFFDCFPNVRDGANQAVRSSLCRGYGLTLTGLRRFIEKGNNRFKNAMRNHPIQGGSAAIFKTALLRIDAHFRETQTQLLLPRHDSILLLTPKGTEDEVIAICKVIMIQAIREKFPRLHPRVDDKSGDYWPTELTLEEFYKRECQIESA